SINLLPASKLKSRQIIHHPICMIILSLSIFTALSERIQHKNSVQKYFFTKGQYVYCICLHWIIDNKIHYGFTLHSQ
ncbi:hypothetical protein, partial [Yersinia pestis]